jgi:hypothetical protein
MSIAGWQEHARAAETALARGTPDVARRELHRAIQVPAFFPSGRKRHRAAGEQNSGRASDLARMRQAATSAQRRLGNPPAAPRKAFADDDEVCTAVSLGGRGLGFRVRV